MAFFRLIRWPNLIIVGITQALLYYMVLMPAYNAHDIIPQLVPISFACLSLITILITAGGYIINDILDQEADAKNKPNRLIIGKVVDIQVATWLYSLLGFIGFILAIYLGFSSNNVEWIGLYPLALMFLYWYSTDLKLKPFWGNFMVAIFCAGVAGIVWLAEWESYLQVKTIANDLAIKIQAVFVWYMSFAFLGTLYREIIKDMEDIGGDQVVGCKTIPIVFGLKKAKIIAAAYALILFSLLVFQLFYYREVFNWYFILFCILAILCPLLYSLYRLYHANTSNQFRFLSQLSKLILLNGVLLLLFLGKLV